MQHNNNDNLDTSELPPNSDQEQGTQPSSFIDNQIRDELTLHEGICAENIALPTNAVAYWTPAEQPAVHLPAEPVLSRAQWLQLYLLAAIFCNLYFLFLEGHFDIGFWKNWVTQLASTGFTNYQGDYPPLWSNWLWVVSRVYLYLNQPIDNNIFFKYLTQLPISIYHLLLTYLVYKIATIYAKSETHFHTALILTVFNPAILFNGPIWGQIDVAPVVPVIAAIFAGTSRRYQVLMVPLYILGMLTKLQMIAFAPVMGILFFRHIKIHLIGILLAIAIFIIAFLPNILAHNFIQAFSLPYIGSMNMFNAATMGASNIWILLTGNLAPDNLILFGIDQGSPLATLLSVRHSGMIAFSLVCLCIFISGMRKLALNRFEQNQAVAASDIFFYATLCATTFFAVLPGMHERYLLPASVIALAYYATSSKKLIYPVALGFISAFNLTMSHGVRTTSIWPSLSWIMMAFFIYALMELAFGEKWLKAVKYSVMKITAIKWLSLWVLLTSIVITSSALYKKTMVHNLTLAPNQINLTQQALAYTKQDYGTLQINLNVDGHPLSVGGKRYSTGFGTHANSTITIKLPDNTTSFSFIAGLDDEVDSADVAFLVFGDGVMLWHSSVIYHPDKDTGVITIPLNNVHELSLQVDGQGNIGGDHADWINPVITLNNQAAQ